MSMTDIRTAAPEGLSAAESKPVRLAVQNVVKEFQRHGGDLHNAVDDVSFEVRTGELLVLLGPSGCGKSTLLRCIAGLESPTKGSISINGKPAFDSSAQISLAPNERDVNMMFQSYALWPHMNLQDNVAYPLRSAGVKKSAARNRAAEYLDLVGLGGLTHQHPGMISGGQQQRVALARTLISEPSIVLFDEPLSNVDARIRVKLRSLLVRLHKQLEFAAVYVTHDQVEAMGLGTRIAVMRHGRVDQLASPAAVYERPSNRATAEFIGEANFISASVLERDGDMLTVDLCGSEMQVPRQAHDTVLDVSPGDDVTLMVRPEKCRIVPAELGNGSPGSWRGVVMARTFSGAHTEYQCQLDDQSVTVWAFGAPDPQLRESAEVEVTIPSESLRVVSDD
ncbi:ABC transporter ATP-binding protein [Arthrobacter sp. Marseille-P9274]|uniref:ABC transporter ATP-binding protein n=1 Tax=Arthrobacter sp. Marseille-P9274 TaxID=2866572 RepID=UPI0021C61109|nr:ABC transporter ATP-binding protein [Arthrobacter sp. Marseille-P9274]